MQIHPVVAVALAGLCAACVAPVPRPDAAVLDARWGAHAATLQPLTTWTLRGRLAVRTDDHGGQATLSWERAAARHAIRLNGPFGQGVVRVTQDEQGAQLTDAANRVYRATTAEELLYLYTGWQLPITQLDWWVRGLPAPGSEAARELDVSGRLKSLRQQGWEVRYEAYQQVAGYQLPSRLTLVRAADSAAPAIEARLVVDRWAQVR